MMTGQGLNLREYFLKEMILRRRNVLNFYTGDKFEKILQENGLSKLSSFMAVPKQNSFRDVPNRLTVGIDLTGEDSESYRVYLKRHWLDSKSKNTGPHQEAQSEADNLKLLKNQGFPVPDLVASGWGYLNKRPVGFVAIHEVPGLQGDHFIEENLESDNWTEVKNNLVSDLAELASRFHNQASIIETFTCATFC